MSPKTDFHALANYLAELEQDTVTMTIDEIRSKVGHLPQTAMRHTWWADSGDATRGMARHLKAVGWKRLEARLSERKVKFCRMAMNLAEMHLALRPTAKKKIYDLLGQAGISTAGWHKKFDGTAVVKVKSNPNFCYNWSFGTPEEGYVLCIWYEFLRVDGDEIVYTENMRALAKRLTEQSNDERVDEAQRRRAASQASRATQYDIVLADSFKASSAVRVIVSDGTRHDREQQDEEGSSTVKNRELDRMPWYVHSYSVQTGDIRMVRGRRPDTLEDVATEPGDEKNDGDKKRPDKIQLRAIRVRQGQVDFRSELRAEYSDTCAVTGCTVIELLDAAHIRPHSVAPNYNSSNGLLLRTDIHTLFDLYKLCIDSDMKVRLSQDLLDSPEYQVLEGRLIKLPKSARARPDKDALQERFQQFRP